MTRGGLGLAWVVTALCVLPTLGGCGDDTRSEATHIDVDESRARVQSATRSLAGMATGAGLEVTELTGRWTVCSVDPPLDEYAAGGSGAPQRSVAETVTAVAEALEQDGWTREGSATTPRPYATFSRDGLTASVGEVKHRPGEVDFGVRDRCVASSETSDGGRRESFAP